MIHRRQYLSDFFARLYKQKETLAKKHMVQAVNVSRVRPDDDYDFESELRRLCMATDGRIVPELRPARPIEPCTKELDCGCTCLGVKDELRCMRCLNPDCRN